MNTQLENPTRVCECGGPMATLAGLDSSSTSWLIGAAL